MGRRNARSVLPRTDRDGGPEAERPFGQRSGQRWEIRLYHGTPFLLSRLTDKRPLFQTGALADVFWKTKGMRL